MNHPASPATDNFSADRMHIPYRMAIQKATFASEPGQPAAVGVDPAARDAEKTQFNLVNSTHDTTIYYPKRPANIADNYDDLLALLSARSRLGMIAQLSVGFYEGWRPSRAEIADLVALELGVLKVDEAHERARQRRRRTFVPDIIPLILSSATSSASRT